MAVTLFLLQPASSQTSLDEYKVKKMIPVEGNGGWDYLAVDPATRRLFISHGTCVEVLDLKTEKVIGQIQNTPGVHGIAFVPSLGKGFISAGKLDSVVVFDLSTLQLLAKIPAGKNPDFILFDPFSKQVFTFNGRDNSITAIEPATNHVVGTIHVSGKPEAAVSDGAGNIFCNIEDKATVVKFSAVTLKIESEWPLAPGKDPTGLALDLKNKRLFAGCSGSNQLVVMDATNGRIIDALPIGDRCDGVLYIPDDRNVVTSNGEGTLTVIRQEGADKYMVVQTLGSHTSARTLTYDEKVRKIYLPCAVVTTENGKRSIVPNTFKIVVVSK